MGLTLARWYRAPDHEISKARVFGIGPLPSGSTPWGPHAGHEVSKYDVFGEDDSVGETAACWGHTLARWPGATGHEGSKASVFGRGPPRGEALREGVTLARWYHATDHEVSKNGC